MDANAGVIFVGWLEDIGDLLPEINKRTWAIIQTQNKRFWIVKLQESDLANADNDTAKLNQTITTILNGKKYQIQGVATVLDLHKLINNPYFVEKILSKNSLENFYYMIEMSENRNLENANIVDKLVKNQPLPKSALGSLFDFFKNEFKLVVNPNTGQSEVGLLLKDESGSYIDRSIVEDGKPKDTHFRPYESIAASLKNLASNKGTYKQKHDAKNNALINAHRAIADSLGYNLDEILDEMPDSISNTNLHLEDIAEFYVKKGKLHKVLEKYKSQLIKNNGKLDELLHDKNFLKEVVGVTDRELEQVEVTFLQKWLKEEEFNMRFAICKLIPKDKCTTADLANYWKAMGFSETYEGETFHQESPETVAKSNVSGSVVSAGAAMVKYQNVLKSGSLLNQVDQREDELIRDTYDMVRQQRKDLVRTIDRMRMQLLSRDPAIKEKVNAIATKEFDTRSAIGVPYDDALHDARNKGSLFLKDKIREVLKRTDNAMLTSRYAERLFLLGLMQDVWGKVGTEDDSLDRFLRSRRASRLFTQSLVNKTKEDGKKANAKVSINKDPALALPLAINALNFEAKNQKDVPGIYKVGPNVRSIAQGRALADIPIKNKKLKDLNKVPPMLTPLKYIPILNEMPIHENFAVIKTSQFDGIFGEYGVYDVLENIYGNHNLLQRYQVEEFAELSEVDMLRNAKKDTDQYGHKSNLYDLYSKINEAIENKDSNSESLMPYLALASALGLVTIDMSNDKAVTTINSEHLAKFKDHFGAFFDANRGDDLFRDLSNYGLEEEDRVEFLRSLDYNGQADQMDTKFMSPLKIYNQYIEATYGFFAVNVIFNDNIGQIPILGPLILSPAQKLVRSFGFAKGRSLLTTLTKLNAVKNLGLKTRIALAQLASSLFGKKQSTPPVLLNNMQATSDLSGVFKPIINRGLSVGDYMPGSEGFLNKDVTVLSEANQKKLAYGINKSLLGLGFLTHEGIAKIVPPLWNTAWNFTTNIILLRPFSLINSGLITFRTGWQSLIKFITYPVTAVFLGGLGCIGLLTLVIAGFVGSTFATFNKTENIGGGAGLEGSSLLKVTQSSSYNTNADHLEYKITILNIGTKDATIAGFNDEISLVTTCDSNKGTLKLSDPQFIGKLEDPLVILPNNSNVVGQVLKPREKIDLTVKLLGVNQARGSYINDISVKAKEETVEVARDQARVDIKESGCFKCPSGWGTTGPLSVYQGAFTKGGTHDIIEGVDIFSLPISASRKIYATHDGYIFVNLHNFEDYGFNAEVRSTDNSYMTIYGHMAVPPQFKNGTLVKKGDIIGLMGSTGLGDKHLHYEFRDIPWTHGPNKYECISGQPLKMKKVSSDSYVPKTVPQGCIGFGSCNITEK